MAFALSGVSLLGVPFTTATTPGPTSTSVGDFGPAHSHAAAASATMMARAMAVNREGRTVSPRRVCGPFRPSRC